VKQAMFAYVNPLEFVPATNQY